MGHGTHPSQQYHERPRWQWRALILSVVVAYVLGTIGFVRYDTDRGREGHVFEAMYHAAQMFVLHAPALEPPLNFPLEIGRWLALILFWLAAASTAYRVFSAEIGALSLKFLKGHVVICGRGHIVLDMVRSQPPGKLRRRVVVIADPDDDELIQGCNALHIILLVGSPRLLLAQARLAKAKRLIVVYEQDGLNVDIAMTACAICRQSRPLSSPPLDCRTQVSDIDLRESLRRHHLPVPDERCRVHFFDFFDEAARNVLLTQLPFDHEGIAQDDPRHVHLVIVGFGTMGRRVAIKAAQLGHFANTRPIRISVIDREARQREREMLFRYPNIRQTCELKFHECPIQSADAYELIEIWCRMKDTVTSFIVCLDDDAVALDVAMRLLPIVQDERIPLAVRMSRPDGLTSLLTQHASSSETNRLLHGFGWLDQSNIARMLDDDVREQMAKLVQVNFVELAQSQGRDAVFDEAVRKWDSLANEDYKESNRQQVDHIAIKLRAVRRELVPMSETTRDEAPFTDAEVSILAEMEHDRWVAERQLAGWTLSEIRDEARRKNPNLVAWGRLSPKIKQYDIDAVTAIPALVREVKQMKICRQL